MTQRCLFFIFIVFMNRRHFKYFLNANFLSIWRPWKDKLSEDEAAGGTGSGGRCGKGWRRGPSALTSASVTLSWTWHKWGVTLVTQDNHSAKIWLWMNRIIRSFIIDEPDKEVTCRLKPCESRLWDFTQLSPPAHQSPRSHPGHPHTTLKLR